MAARRPGRDARGRDLSPDGAAAMGKLHRTVRRAGPTWRWPRTHRCWSAGDRANRDTAAAGTVGVSAPLPSLHRLPLTRWAAAFAGSRGAARPPTDERIATSGLQRGPGRTRRGSGRLSSAPPQPSQGRVAPRLYPRASMNVALAGPAGYRTRWRW
jgi:hypothetical protein